MILLEISVLSIIAIVGLFHLCECQKCGVAKIMCVNNKCCSFFGFCGDSKEHCSEDCQHEFGRCNHPSLADPSKGFVISPGACGSNNKNKYCSASRCCSEFGFCGNTTEHCDDGCQPLFGRCNSIPSCNLYGKENLFPSQPLMQRSLENKVKNYWFALCGSAQIFDDVSQPLPNVTCQKDGSLPEINPKCVDNIIYKKPVRNNDTSILDEKDVVVDGNLVTCRELDANKILEIQIISTNFLIRDIRITTQKTSRGNFTLEIFDRRRQKITILFKREFDDVIKYGHSVVFFTNVTAAFADTPHIRLTPHVKMNICEIEASSNDFASTVAKTKWTKYIIISSAIFGFFFLVTVVLATILCLRSRRMNKKKRLVRPQNVANGPVSCSGNTYSLRSKALPPIPVSRNNRHSNDSYQEQNFDEFGEYEEICPPTRSDDRTDREYINCREMSNEGYLAPRTLTKVGKTREPELIPFRVFDSASK